MNKRLVPRVTYKSDKPSLTKQSHKDECDINKIMKRFKNTQSPEFLNRFQGYLNARYGDFSQVQDYRTALNQISQARATFDALPAVIRTRFRNDPAEFLDFCGNPKNVDEMISLGLATKRAPSKDAPSKTSDKVVV